MKKIVRREYPRPELKRRQWQNLNGEWGFSYNLKPEQLQSLLDLSPSLKINVPFCPESKLSGLRIVDEIITNCLYTKDFFVHDHDGKVILNFEAVYYACEVFVNGKKIGENRGGHTPFSFDITDYVVVGKNDLKVFCTSDLNDGTQPNGKQSDRVESYFVLYTRTTGIWQTVWLEYLPKNYIKSTKIIADTNGNVNLGVNCFDKADKLKINVFYKSKKVYAGDFIADGANLKINFKVDSPKLWSADSPNLYKIEYELISKESTDKAQGYFGFRTVEIKGDKIYINGKKIFQRLVLDQGYYVDGVYTAKSDKELKKDIFLAKKLGFNGARLHQKVFERRFLYHADKLGYYVWDEFPCWGFDHSLENASDYFYPEWKRVVERDFNHPSIICWCPMNENWDYKGKKQNDSFVKDIYEKTKALDSTRFVIDVSWNYHVKTDVYDVHDYVSEIGDFRARYLKFEDGKVYDEYDQNYSGQPYMLSEYGGIKWKNATDAFGYGDTPVSEEAFIEKYVAFSNILHENARISGICYTQLYNVEQEQNGLYFFDRKPKFGKKQMKIMRDSMQKRAKYEEEK